MSLMNTTKFILKVVLITLNLLLLLGSLELLKAGDIYFFIHINNSSWIEVCIEDSNPSYLFGFSSTEIYAIIAFSIGFVHLIEEILDPIRKDLGLSKETPE